MQEHTGQLWCCRWIENVEEGDQVIGDDDALRDKQRKLPKTSKTLEAQKCSSISSMSTRCC